MDPLQAGNLVLNFLEAHPWILITLIAHGTIIGAVAYLILLERKIASWVQDRIGPNRTNLGFGLIPFLKDKKMMGLGQPLADGIKFILKEDYRPKGADKWLFTAAPIMMIVVVIISIAVLPWGGIKQTTREIDAASWVTGQEPKDLTAVAGEKVKSELPADAAGTSEIDVFSWPSKEITPDLDATIDSRLKSFLPAGAVEVPGTRQRHVEARADANGIVIDHLLVNLVYYIPRTEDRQDSDGVWRQHRLVVTTYRYAFQSASLNIGVLFILAALSLAVYGVVIGGWASNNKYSFLGGLRATANMISYEIPLGLAVLCVVIVFGTLNLEDIVNKQAYSIMSWNIWSQPFAFIMFLICIHAEANRAPFDMAEAEQELVGGYHTEYSAMRFALFFLGEYAGMVTTSAVCIALFFGGWHFPGVDRLVVWIVNTVTGGRAEAMIDLNNGAVTNSLVVCIVRALVFFTKTIGVIFFFMWVRWSLPRFRFDQLMNLAWRGLIPISLALLMVTAIIVYCFGGAAGTTPYYLPLKSALALGVANWLLLFVAIVVGALLPSTDGNRKIRVPNSRFLKTPLPKGVVSVSSN